MNATMEAPTDAEQLVAERPTSVLFFSRRRQLRCVAVPKEPIYGPSGRKQGETKGKVIEFREAGDVGRFETDDPEEIAFLRNHVLFGNPNEGLWEVVQTAPPVGQDELAAAMEAVTSFDLDRLRAMHAQESEGWAREALLAPLGQSIERIEQLYAEKAAADAAAQG